MPIWTPKSHLRELYDTEFYVMRGLSYSAALQNRDPRGVRITGGDFDIEPAELERKVMGDFLDAFGEFRNCAIGIYHSEDPWVFENHDHGTKHPFSYIIQLSQFQWSRNNDREQRSVIISSLDEVGESYAATVLPIPSGVSISLGNNLKMYDLSMIGNAYPPVVAIDVEIFPPISLN